MLYPLSYGRLWREIRRKEPLSKIYISAMRIDKVELLHARPNWPAKGKIPQEGKNFIHVTPICSAKCSIFNEQLLAVGMQ
jgi:hypothetical protein